MPFRYIDVNPIDKVVDNVVDNVVDKIEGLNETQCKILLTIRNNSNITQSQLSVAVGIGKTAIQNNIVVLKKRGYIERVGSNKTGYWKVNE